MKTLGIVLIVTGVVAFAMPVVGFLLKGKPQEEVAEKKMDPLSLGPMLGVMFLSVGGGILVAGAITGKK
mgnify:CR=1 FL=1